MIKTSKLKDICKITNGYAFKSDLYTDVGARVIRITNVQKGKIVDNDPRLYPFSELHLLEQYEISKGDILMSLTGNVGRVGKFPAELLPAYINQRVCRIRSTSDKLFENYLFHFLNSDLFESNAVRNSAGAAQLNLSTNWILEFEIPLPPIDQQIKMAAILDAADELRQNNKAVLAKYDELAQSLFLDMFGDPVNNPKGWEECLIENLCIDIVDCINKTAATVNHATPYKMIRTTNVRSYCIDVNQVRYVEEEVFKKWNRRLTPKRGDVVFTREAPMGEAGIILTDDNLILGQRTMIYRTDNALVNNHYLLFQLMGDAVHKQIARLSMGSTVKHLSVPSCKKFKILSPPIALQNQFAEYILLIEEQRLITQASFEKTESLFSNLLQKAFTGELTGTSADKPLVE